MEIKVLCDRCYEDVIENRVFYKYGSAVYCEECNKKINQEFLSELVGRYVKVAIDEYLKNFSMGRCQSHIGKEA